MFKIEKIGFFFVQNRQKFCVDWYYCPYELSCQSLGCRLIVNIDGKHCSINVFTSFLNKPNIAPLESNEFFKINNETVGFN